MKHQKQEFTFFCNSGQRHLKFLVSICIYLFAPPKPCFTLLHPPCESRQRSDSQSEGLMLEMGTSFMIANSASV